ncbi:hypothetical protein AX769_07350 [Frondihabitans sp. PAMC 28766]|uniref:phosphotriesterase family protein n=1 Tax=Frondihabitans sp. PAMC 28766 TaxID=1795630 RepID=UPI00078CFD1F|nr:phosphotriesterase [Frondihabitans sp. PAMC 28766]AMM20012.1 hypothetical protein AX769_07350 [Frondihabitans sp. PAMC 28766]
MTAGSGLVETIGGPIDADVLGRTLLHEHVLLVEPELDANYPGWFDEDSEVRDAQHQLRRLKEAGIDTLVDLTVLGLGRNVDLVRRAAEGSGLNIVVATGIYTMDELPPFFRRRGPGRLMGGDDPLEAFLVRDIVQGIAETGVKAGVIKCATGERGVTDDVDRVLRATATAHLRTGAPISTHTDAGTFRGHDQQRILGSEGVDLGRVLIGHSGDSEDLGYLTELMDAGSYIGMDRFGMDTILPTENRCRVVAELVKRGYASRIVLSHDTNCYTVNWEKDVRERVLPDWHHRFISEYVLGRLGELGVSPDDIDQMMRVNPRSFLAGAPSRTEVAA